MNKLDLALAIDRFWAIEPTIGTALIEHLLSVDALEDLTGQDVSPLKIKGGFAWETSARARRDEEPSPAQRLMYVSDEGVAIIPIIGTMTKRPAGSMGGPSTATVGIRRQLRVAASDPVVKSILLVLDSPGGQVGGVMDLADDVNLARAAKPVVGYVEDICASACLWVGSQCGQLFASRGADVGSIGVYAAIPDVSAAAAMEGVKVHLLSTGKYKGAGVPGVPISQDWLDDWQSQINDTFDQFLNAVATGRGMEIEDVRAAADGRVYSAAKALEMGLIDGICSMDECLSMLTNSGDSSARKSAASNGKPSGETKMADGKKPGLWEGLKSLLSDHGVEVEAGEGGGQKTADATPATPAAPVKAELDPEVANAIAETNAQTAAMVKAMAKEQAKSFAEGLVTKEKKATPAEREGIENAFYQALCADGGGAPKFGVEDGKLLEGASCKALRECFAVRPSLSGFMLNVVGGADERKELDPNQGEAFSEKRREELLSKTGTGKAALNGKKKEAK